MLEFDLVFFEFVKCSCVSICKNTNEEMKFRLIITSGISLKFK